MNDETEIVKLVRLFAEAQDLYDGLLYGRDNHMGYPWSRLSRALDGAYYRLKRRREALMDFAKTLTRERDR